MAQCRAVSTAYRALFVEYSTLLVKSRALLGSVAVNGGLYITLLVQCIVVATEYRALSGVCFAVAVDTGFPCCIARNIELSIALQVECTVVSTVSTECRALLGESFAVAVD